MPSVALSLSPTGEVVLVITPDGLASLLVTLLLGPVISTALFIWASRRELRPAVSPGTPLPLPIERAATVCTAAFDPAMGATGSSATTGLPVEVFVTRAGRHYHTQANCRGLRTRTHPLETRKPCAYCCIEPPRSG